MRLDGASLQANKQLHHIVSAQETVAHVSELIHAATLVHDDLLDQANTRRGALSVQKKYSHSHVLNMYIKF